MRAVTAGVRNPVTVVWAVLVVVTVLSWVVAPGEGGAPGVRVGLDAVVLLVAVVKVRFIGAWFMELRTAPRGLRAVFDGWCLLLAVVLVGPYVLPVI